MEKETSMKRMVWIAVVALMCASAFAQRPERRGMREPNLLPPRVLEELNLTADQQKAYDALNAEFRTKAEAVRELRKNSVEKFKALLTEEQKKSLEEAMEEARERFEGRGGRRGPPPPE
jgi:biopolymer transport protein ExbB/TolQ